jgi:hypothetical protein
MTNEDEPGVDVLGVNSGDIGRFVSAGVDANAMGSLASAAIEDELADGLSGGVDCEVKVAKDEADKGRRICAVSVGGTGEIDGDNDIVCGANGGSADWLVATTAPGSDVGMDANERGGERFREMGPVDGWS